MIVTMKKIGTVLNSRPAGREAFLAIRPSLPPVGDQDIILDFGGVEVLTPSFADEFIPALAAEKRYRITFVHTENITVQKTLAFLMPDWKDRGFAFLI